MKFVINVFSVSFTGSTYIIDYGIDGIETTLFEEPLLGNLLDIIINYYSEHTIFSPKELVIILTEICNN